MNRTLTTPGKFILGRNALAHLADYLIPYGENILLIALPEDAERVDGALQIARDRGVELTLESFHGECSMAEIQRITQANREGGYQAVIGLGGGKAIDTAKAVSSRLELPLIVIPTIASTDAPCSAMAIVYDENHVMVCAEFLQKSPDIVLVDSEVIAKAPTKFLVAGFGDALATYYEARACVQSGAKNYVNGITTQAAWALAQLCRDILLRDSAKALSACKNNVVTTALENVIEANLYLSCIGFESVGCAAAHALHNAMTVLEETHAASHGEKVAIGLLVQLILEDAPDEEMKLVLDYFNMVGLPVKLSQIGLENATEAQFRRVAQKVLSKKNSILNHPFEITEDMIVDAFQMVDSLQEIYYK